MNTLLIKGLCGLIRLYQLTFSSILGRQCRFQPTCSAYGIEAIQKHGPWRGIILTIKRLGKCHPWPKLGGKSGYDPVP
jgi:uncharacterized protein